MENNKVESKIRLKNAKERLSSALFRLETALQKTEADKENIKQIQDQLVGELNQHISGIEAILEKEEV